MADKLAPKGWKLWYNYALRRHIEGANAETIAKETGKSERAVASVIASKEFGERYDDMWSTFVVPPIEIIKHYKHDLVEAKLDIALNATNITVKNAAIDWLLEKFPEFKKGADTQLVVQQYMPTNDEIRLSRETVDDIQNIVEMNSKQKEREEDIYESRLKFGK